MANPVVTIEMENGDIIDVYKRQEILWVHEVRNNS